MLFVDNAALAAHVEEDLQVMITSLLHACKEFGLTIRIKQTNIMTQNVPNAPNITIDNTLKVVPHFTYLSST